MFKTLVVALDLGHDGDRALPVAKALSRAGKVGIDLVTVSSPGLAAAPDACELEHRARANGWDPDAWSVVHHADVAAGLLHHAARHDEPLLIMATSARSPWSATMRRDVTHEVLRHTDRPVLLIGPEVPDWFAPDRTSLVACLDDGDHAERAIPAILSWHHTFATGPLHATTVVGDLNVDARARDRLDRFGELLAAQGIHADIDLVYGEDAVTALELTADRLHGAIFVATSARYTDGQLHWHSTTRELVRRARRPVLVVPARPSPVSLRTAVTDPGDHVTLGDLTAVPTGTALAMTSVRRRSAEERRTGRP